MIERCLKHQMYARLFACYRNSFLSFKSERALNVVNEMGGGTS